MKSIIGIAPKNFSLKEQFDNYQSSQPSTKVHTS